ncbi:MAG: hypothetical protein F4X61_12010 [Rhodothermaceae bacterium]|nr:hypothetical protein [Rhodothermaceae bacterium]
MTEIEAITDDLKTLAADAAQDAVVRTLTVLGHVARMAVNHDTGELTIFIRDGDAIEVPPPDQTTPTPHVIWHRPPTKRPAEPLL